MSAPTADYKIHAEHQGLAASRWSSCCCGPSPPAVPRSPASRRSATACRPSRSPSRRTPRPRSPPWACWPSPCSAGSSRSRWPRMCGWPRTRPPTCSTTAGRSAPVYTQDPVIAQVAEAVFGDATRSRSSSWPRSPRWCSSSPPTPPTTASRCSARSSPRTATCRGSCTPAATGSPSPTASCCWPASPRSCVYIYGANSTRLIQLYIVGVFVSFTLSQTGMVRHWNRHLRTETDPAKRRHMVRSRAINTFGAFLTGLVLVDRAAHEVHARRLGRGARHGGLLRHDDGDPLALRPASPRRSPPRRTRRRLRPAVPGALDRPGLQDSTSPPCAPLPTPS